jgi:hypothetical protein
MIKKYIYKVTVNDKYEMFVMAEGHDEARNIGKEFFLQNNFFVDKTVREVGTSVHLDLGEVINLKTIEEES